MAERRSEAVTREATGYDPDPAARGDTHEPWSEADRFEAVRHRGEQPGADDPDAVRYGTGFHAPADVPDVHYPGMGYAGTAYTPPPASLPHGSDGGAMGRERIYEDRPMDQKSPAEIERDIRRTRAELSETVDAIERRLSPDYLKHELKESMHEGIDYLRDRFDPRRIAKNTGRSMLETIKENPLPSLIAGLSIGWLLMKGHESDDDRWSERAYGRGAYGRTDYGRTAYGPDYYREPSYRSGFASYPEAYYPGQPPYGQSAYYEQSYRARPYEDHEGDGGRHSLRERVGEKAGELRHRTGEMAGELRHRTGEMAGHAQQRMHDLGHEMHDRLHDVSHGVRHQTRRTMSGLEHFVYHNPLAAGALAAGVGALLGALLPSTEKENELLGETRDRLVDQARDVAGQTIERTKPVAQRVAEEAKDALHEVAQTARDEARNVMSTAKEGAREVRDETTQHLHDRT